MVEPFPYFPQDGDLDEEFWARVNAYKDLHKTHPLLKNDYDVNFHEVMLMELVGYELEIRRYTQMIALDPSNKDILDARTKAQNAANKLREQLNHTPDKMAKLKKGHNQQKIPLSQQDRKTDRIAEFEKMNPEFKISHQEDNV